MKFTALLVLLALVSAHALPTFKNKGGPPDVQGAWAGPFAGGYNVGIKSADGTYAYAMTSNGGKMTFAYGQYLSWECAGKNSYRAIAEVTDISSTGKVTVAKYCEIGRISLASGIYRWAESTEGCPKSYTDVEVRSSAYLAPTSLKC